LDKGKKITSWHIEMTYKLNSTKVRVKIFDLHDESGKAAATMVELIIPV